ARGTRGNLRVVRPASRLSPHHARGGDSDTLMPLRVAFDMDGVLADFGQAFRAIENRLFGANSPSGAGEPARLEENRETNARRSEDAGRAAKARVDDGARFEDDARERMPALPGDPQPAK